MPGSNTAAASLLQSTIMMAALALVHALLVIVAFPPVGLWPLIILSPVPLAILALQARSTMQASLVVLVVQTILWMWMSRWLWHITEAGLIPYALTMASMTVLLVWVLRRVSHHALLGRYPMTIMLPVIWTAVEFFRGEIFFDGYPWFLLAHPLVEAPVLVQSADLMGTYFISFLGAMFAGLLVDGLRVAVWNHEKKPLISKAQWAVFAGIVSCIAVANVSYGLWRISQTEVLTPGPSLLVVQTNLPQDNKMRSTAEEHWQHYQQFVTQTLDAHRAAIADGVPIDLIAWPETMVQGWGFEPKTLEFFVELGFWQGYRFAMATEVVAGDLNVPMLVGSPAVEGPRLRPDHTLDWDGNFNSAYLITPLTDDAELGQRHHQRYDKIFLTPFGETMPYIRAWPWLQEKFLAIGAQGMEFNLESGVEPRVLEMEIDGKPLYLATPICFEATMAWVCRSLVYARGHKRADVMVNLTNDGWFGNHHAGRMQHAQISRFRSIENRIPVVRVANTGLSMSIDSVGRVEATIGEGRYGESQQPGTLIAQPYLDSRNTLYGRVGDVWGWGGLIVGFLSVVVTFWKKVE